MKCRLYNTKRVASITIKYISIITLLIELNDCITTEGTINFRLEDDIIEYDGDIFIDSMSIDDSIR